jgi:hypothetical protein
MSKLLSEKRYVISYYLFMLNLVSFHLDYFMPSVRIYNNCVLITILYSFILIILECFALVGL